MFSVTQNLPSSAATCWGYNYTTSHMSNQGKSDLYQRPGKKPEIPKTLKGGFNCPTNFRALILTSCILATLEKLVIIHKGSITRCLSHLYQHTLKPMDLLLQSCLNIKVAFNNSVKLIITKATANKTPNPADSNRMDLLHADQQDTKSRQLFRDPQRRITLQWTWVVDELLKEIVYDVVLGFRGYFHPLVGFIPGGIIW